MGRSPVLETGAGEVGYHLVASGTPYVDLVLDDVGLDERRLCQLLCAVGVAGEEPCGPQSNDETHLKCSRSAARASREKCSRNLGPASGAAVCLGDGSTVIDGLSLIHI